MSAVETLPKTKVPAFPFSPKEFNQQYVDQNNRVLTQYLNQIDYFVSYLLDPSGQRYLSAPHGSFYDVATQSDGINTPNAVQFGQTDTTATEAFTIANNASSLPTRVTAQYQGCYNMQFSLQLQNTDNAAYSVGIWARINGVDVPNSCTDITVPARKSAGEYGYAVAAWNFVLAMQANDYFELMWATPSTLVTIPYIPEWSTAAGTNTPTKIYSQAYNRPATPSAILTASFVSRL